MPILENAHSFRGQKLLQANLWRLGNVLVNFNNLFCCDSVLLLGLDFLLCSLETGIAMGKELHLQVIVDCG